MLFRSNHEFEYRAVAVDGRIVWLRDIVRVIKNERGQPIILRGAMIDISRSKVAESALKRHVDAIQSLQEIGQRVLNEGDMRDALDNILGLALSLGGYDVGAIRLLNGNGNIDCVSFRGYENLESIHMLTDPQSPNETHERSNNFSRVLTTSQTNVLEDIPSRDGLQGFKREGIRDRKSVV